MWLFRDCGQVSVFCRALLSCKCVSKLPVLSAFKVTFNKSFLWKGGIPCRYGPPVLARVGFTGCQGKQWIVLKHYKIVTFSLLFFWPPGHSMQDLSFPARDEIHAPCSGNTVSYALNCHGRPYHHSKPISFLMQTQDIRRPEELERQKVGIY